MSEAEIKRFFDYDHYVFMKEWYNMYDRHLNYFSTHKPTHMTNNEDKAMRFNDGKLKWSLMHFDSMAPMIEVLMFGAKKYAAYNWMKKMEPTEIMDSLLRHVAALNRGEINDPESGLPHIGHIMCNAMFYSYHTQQRTPSLVDIMKPYTDAANNRETEVSKERAGGGKRKFTDQQIRDIRRKYDKEKVSFTQLCLTYKTSVSTIYNIVKRRSYKNVL